MSTQQKIPDGCPEWADILIKKMLKAEIATGHVLGEPDKSKPEWSSHSLEDLLNDSDPLKDFEVESMFANLCQKLNREGFTSEAIAGFVNSRFAPFAKLAYCDTSEVEESLK